MADGDRVEIEASLKDAISAAVTRIEQRVQSLENEVQQLGRTGQRSGREFAEGVDAAAKSADNAGDQARQAKRPVKELGDEAVKTGAKASAGATGLKKFARSAKKTKRELGGFRAVLSTLKFAGAITAVFALAGGLSALGAGAVIAVGGLAPMVGVLAGIPAFFLAGKLSVLAFKLAAEQLEPVVTRMKNQFTELGPVIARGGLQKGLEYLANSLGGLAKVTGQGLAGLGGEIGAAARYTGDLVKNRAFLAQVSAIFDGLRPVVRDVSMGLIAIGRALLNVVQGSLPMVQEMARYFRWVAEGLQAWTAEQLANGRMAAWLMKAWNLFLRVTGVVVDVLIGLFNIFRIGAGYGREFGLSIEDAAYKFRLWTDSAEGQARINKYFQDSLPALREMGKLLGMIVGGLASLGTSQNVAPLLEQIRTEFAPALGAVVSKLSGQDGLGPALISGATALLNFFAALDFSGLTAFVVALTKLIEGVVWIMQNVPGASFVISGLVGAFFGLKLLAPIFGIVGKFAGAFGWIKTALDGTAKLTAMQRLFAGGMQMLGKVFSVVGQGIIVVIRAIGVAMMANPIIAIIAAIIIAIVLLWENCAWFRDLVIGVWNAIKDAAVTAWNWIVNVVTTVINKIVEVASSIWQGIVSVWNTVIDAIATAARWLWENVIQPVWNVIATAAEIAWNVVKFIVQTVIYVIVGIITLMAVVAEKVWQLIAFGAKWLWNTILLPVFTAVKDFVVGVWNAIKDAAAFVWNAISAGWNWLWTTILQPIFLFIQGVATMVWNAITTAATAVWNAISAGWQWLMGFLQPLFTGIESAGSAIWNVIKGVASAVVDGIRSAWDSLTGFFSGLWEGISKGAKAAWDGIEKAAKAVGDTVKGVWDAIVNAIKSVWNFIAKGWNSIPDITVPDWVPLIGGKTFGLPKLPTLWHGGQAPGGAAIVGEHGPEPIIINGQLAGMVGTRGPEIAQIPRGGYVVPNLSTLNALPGLAKSLPPSVAAAVARSVPGYAGALTGGGSGGGDRQLTRAIDRLAASMDHRMPPVHVDRSGDVERQVYEAIKKIKREDEARGRYTYLTGGG